GVPASNVGWVKSATSCSPSRASGKARPCRQPSTDCPPGRRAVRSCSRRHVRSKRKTGSSPTGLVRSRSTCTASRGDRGGERSPHVPIRAPRPERGSELEVNRSLSALGCANAKIHRPKNRIGSKENAARNGEIVETCVAQIAPHIAAFQRCAE